MAAILIVIVFGMKGWVKAKHVHLPAKNVPQYEVVIAAVQSLVTPFSSECSSRIQILCKSHLSLIPRPLPPALPLSFQYLCPPHFCFLLYISFHFQFHIHLCNLEVDIK